MDTIEKDFDIYRARKFLYNFFKTFFLSDFSPDLFEAWKRILEGLPYIDFVPFDQALDSLRKEFSKSSLTLIEEEFTRLFLDPFQGEHIPLQASFYLDGKAFGPSLVRLRAFLQEVGLTKKDDVKEPEDHILLLLDFMETLISDAQPLSFQKRLFSEYIFPAFLGLQKRVLKSQARFYPVLFSLMRAFFLLEERFFEEEPTL